jgi:putative transposase
MLKGIEVRIYPTKEQTGMLNSLLGSYRFVYNQCLNFKQVMYNSANQNTNLNQTSEFFHNCLRPSFEWLTEHNTKVLKQSINNLEQAYSNFFKNGSGFPQYKSRYDVQKARFPKEAISVNTFDEKGTRFNLTKALKSIKFECSDRNRNYLLKNKDGIRSITITKKKCGHYYASFLVEGGLLKQATTPANKFVGIDLGIKTLVTQSDGKQTLNPKFIRSNEQRLARLHRNLSRKKPKSKNREKAREKLARKYERIGNQKLDYLHNITSKLVNENQVIIMEDLNVSGMMQNHNLARSIQELSLYEFRRQLEYKATWYGRDLIFVDRFFPSSKLCSGCSHKHENLTLADRTFKCPSCKLEIDRDLNAAINILNEGIRIYNLSGQDLIDYTNDQLAKGNTVNLRLTRIGTRLPESQYASTVMPVDDQSGLVKQEEVSLRKVKFV